MTRHAQTALGLDPAPTGVLPDARSLPSRPCHVCGAPVVDVVDRSAHGCPVVVCDPAVEVVLVVHTPALGVPQVVRPSNALAVHRCGGKG